ncbi:MAG TPA: cytochrome c [Gemmatimonadaceae bacterium]|nr:cytochrome c [Gemmatimonadaceae bacterium]
MGLRPAIGIGIAIAAIGCSSPAPTAAVGRELYASNGCASCHGANGHGDGPVAKTLVPPPRDFRDASAFKNGTDVAAIATTLESGLSSNGGSMPSFRHLTRDERASLALYVISLRTTQASKEQP